MSFVDNTTLEADAYRVGRNVKVRDSVRREQLLDNGTNKSLCCSHIGRTRQVHRRGHLTNRIAARTSALNKIAPFPTGEGGWGVRSDK